MALIMKDGKEMRVPGRAIPAEKCRPERVHFPEMHCYVDFGPVRMLDAMSFSEFRKERTVAQIQALVEARQAKALVAEDTGDLKTAYLLVVKSARSLEDVCKEMIAIRRKEHEDFVKYHAGGFHMFNFGDIHYKILQAWDAAYDYATSPEDKAMCAEKKGFFDRLWVISGILEDTRVSITRKSMSDAEKIELLRMLVRMSEIVGPEFSTYSEFDVKGVKSEIAELEGLSK